MVHDVQQPPANGPALPDCVWNPTGPKAAADRHGRQVGVPRVARVFGYDASPLARFIFRRIRPHSGFLFKNPTHSRWAEMDAGPGQRVGDLHLTQHRTKQLDPVDRISNQVGKPIHRHVRPKQRVVIGASKPCPDRGIGDKEPPSRFGLGPAAHRAEFKSSTGRNCGRRCGSIRRIRAPLIRNSSRSTAISVSSQWILA